MSHALHLVLVAPKIPANTGNIIRLCANTGAHLHLVEPLGFEMEDKKLRRAGLDYHEFAQVLVHPDFTTMRNALDALGVLLRFGLSTKASMSLFDVRFEPVPTALILGSETTGLDAQARNALTLLGLPMQTHSRSLNLANSASIALYEVWRQWGFAPL